MQQSEEPPTRYFWALVILGFVLLFCAVADLALGIANAVVCGLLGSIGYGIWGSVLCLAAGIAGVLAGSSGSRGLIITCMVLSILAALAGAVQLGMGAGSAVADHAAFKQLNGETIPYHTVSAASLSAWNFFSTFGCSDLQRQTYLTRWTGPTTTDALLASFAIIQGIVAIFISIFSCRTSVCYPGETAMPWQILDSESPVATVSTAKV